MNARGEAAAALSERLWANNRRYGSRSAAAASDAVCWLGSQA